MNLTLVVTLAIILFPELSPAFQQNPASPVADIVLRNGYVYTVDNSRSNGTAVAVKNGKIQFVGTDDGAAALTGPSTKVIDLAGKMILPGFIDSHCHPTGAYKHFFEINLTGLPTLQYYLKTIREFVQQHPNSKFVRGRGWSNTLFPKTGPDKKLLDDIASDIPMSFSDDGGHAKWVNSRALKLAGITRETPNPAGGVIEHDPVTGEPTGTLRESAEDLLAKVFPDYTTEEMTKGLEAYQTMALAFGITTAHAASLDVGGSDTQAYENLSQASRLSMRFCGSLYVNPKGGPAQVAGLVQERDKHKNPRFQITGAKLFVDGVVEGSTGYLKEPYLHIKDFRGEPLWKPADLNTMCAELDRNGFQIHVHAIGDGATTMTLDAMAFAASVNGKHDSRGMITHLQLVDPLDIARFKKLGVCAIPQPYWFMKDDYYYKIQVPYLGLKRADEEYPMKSFFDAGVVVASSSDYSVTIPCTPLNAIQIGMTRCKLDQTDPNEVLWPAERVTLDQMIASFTINGAYANFLDRTTGSIEVGKMADLIVLDRNLFDIPVTEISKTKVLLTLFEGKEVFKDKSFTY
ncbi:MAG: amidohydrolase family protein [Ignavibacteriales bacterium]|nr:amidohydrolase family protein [Ignavibacteriales bacterium]